MDFRLSCGHRNVAFGIGGSVAACQMNFVVLVYWFFLSLECARIRETFGFRCAANDGFDVGVGREREGR